MSYKFDEKMKEGLTRGEKLFAKVAREREVLENAEEDLDEYYQKTQKTSPGLEKGKTMFEKKNSSSKILDQAHKYILGLADSYSAEECAKAAVYELGISIDEANTIARDLIRRGYEFTNKNPEKSYMPNGCSGPNGCSAKMMKKNSPETTDGAATIVKGSGPIKSIESTQDNDNLVGYVEGKGKNLTSSDGEAGSSHLSNAKCVKCGGSGRLDVKCPDCNGTGIKNSVQNREGKNEDGFRGEVGLDNTRNEFKCYGCGKINNFESDSSGDHVLKCMECGKENRVKVENSTFTNCAGACGCSEASHKPNAPERCGCSCAECEEKKHEYALKNTLHDACNKCGKAIMPDDLWMEGDGPAFHRACAPKQNKSEYPHDILPNSKGGLKIGQSKYGTK